MIAPTSCRLCGAASPLRRSHIYPEFLYDLAYDEKHRFEVVHLDQQAPDRMEQKGLRERLLCGGCEQQIGRYERYASRVLFESGNSAWELRDGYAVQRGVDYRAFKLFLLSLLWRAGITSLAAFDQVELGAHEPHLREMLQREDPGKPGDYPTLLQVFTKHLDLMQGTLVPPVHRRVAGASTFTSIFAGIQWTSALARDVPLNGDQSKIIGPHEILSVKLMPEQLADEHVSYIAGRLFPDAPDPPAP